MRRASTAGSGCRGSEAGATAAGSDQERNLLPPRRSRSPSGGRKVKDVRLGKPYQAHQGHPTPPPIWVSASGVKKKFMYGEFFFRFFSRGSSIPVVEISECSMLDTRASDIGCHSVRRGSPHGQNQQDADFALGRAAQTGRWNRIPRVSSFHLRRMGLPVQADSFAASAICCAASPSSSDGRAAASPVRTATRKRSSSAA